MTRVSVIIPNWNGRDFLKVCLESLNNQSFKDFEVIVVDNNSSDDSVELMNLNFPKVKVLKLDRNYGFARAVNIGIKEGVGEYLFLLNNDTKVDKNCLRYLVKTADLYPEVGMVASKMKNFYNPMIIDSAGDYIDAVGHADNIGRGQKDGELFNSAGFVFLVNAGAGLYKRKVFERVGYFDEDFFAYFEDVDLSFRAQLQGFKGWYEPRAIVLHIHKATSSRNKSFTEYLQFRNMTQTVIKNFPLYLLFKDFNLLKIILVNINTVRYLAMKGYLKSAIMAEIFIIFNFMKLIRKRSKIQKTKKVSDKYIYENIVPKKVTLFGILKIGF